VDENGDVYRVVGYIEDIDDERTLHTMLQQRAQLDGTTGLKNKDTGHQSIEAALAEIPDGQMDAVMFVDIDNFKSINDTHGHMEGDAVLRQVADCMNHLFRQDDIIARFGGDEFIVYMRNATSEEALGKKAGTLIRSVNAISLPDGRRVGCSIGGTLTAGGEGFAEVFERIDAAVYLAKTAGKNCWRVLKRKEE
jgi:putative two-component system response regulator